MSDARFFVPGLIFAAGLMLSGMADPAKVMGFLDVYGDWDASLAVVMAAALATFAVVNRLVQRRRSDEGEPATRPAVRAAGGAASSFTRATLIGSALFGVGWGLAGFCPGPALVNAGAWRFEALLFVPAMLIGMWGAQRFAAADE